MKLEIDTVQKKTLEVALKFYVLSNSSSYEEQRESLELLLKIVSLTIEGDRIALSGNSETIYVTLEQKENIQKIYNSKSSKIPAIKELRTCSIGHHDKGLNVGYSSEHCGLKAAKDIIENRDYFVQPIY